MAKIKGLVISFAPSQSPDVVTNKLYIQEAPTVVSYDSQSFDVGNTAGAEGMIIVDLQTLVPNVDGVFNIGVAAVDDAGNESDMKTANDIPLDFVAPTPPGEITIKTI
jgi:hypothetical protein